MYIFTKIAILKFCFFASIVYCLFHSMVSIIQWKDSGSLLEYPLMSLFAGCLMELPVGLSRFAFKCPSKTNASLGNVCSLSAMSSFLLKCDLGCISVKSQLNQNLQQFLFLWNDMSHVVYMSHITSHINVYPCNNTKKHTLSFKTTAEYLKKVERNSCSF